MVMVIVLGMEWDGKDSLIFLFDALQTLLLSFRSCL